MDKAAAKEIARHPPTDKSKGIVERFRCLADSEYSDVSDISDWFHTYEEAEIHGRYLLEVGNWRSFSIEKRFVAVRMASQGIYIPPGLRHSHHMS